MLQQITSGEIFRSKTFKKYFENTSWLFLERILRMGIALLVGAYVARYLGAEFFGQLSFAVAFVGLFTAFTELGIQNIMIRELVKSPQDKHRLMGTGFGLKLMGAFVVLLFITITLQFYKVGPFKTALIYIITAGEFFKSFMVINLYYQAKVKSKYVVKVQLVQVLVNAAIKLVLIFTHAPLVYFAITTSLESVIIGIGLLYVYIKRGHRVRKWKYDPKLALNLLNESWPLILFGVALHIQARIDQVMIERMIGDEEVAFYSVALRMIEALGVIPVVIQSSFAPAITKGKMSGDEVYRNRRINFYRLMFVVFLFTSIPTFFLAEWGITLLFGEEYRAAGILLSLFSIRMLFTCMGLAKSNYITNESLFKHTLFTSVIGAAVNVGINYILIPEFGARGAIIATIVSFTVSIFLLDFFFRATRENIKLMIVGMLTFWKMNPNLR